MLFSSAEFLLVFLPILMFSFYILRERGYVKALLPLLIIGSLVFYAAWNWHYLALLFLSIICNYLVGKKLQESSNRLLLTIGIGFNLSLLGYFKYAGFLVDNIISLGASISFEAPILPLAISFFTFQQIAFLVDVYRNKISITSKSEYLLFVTFFPQLIAGPIVHYRQLQPQFNLLQHGELTPKFGLGLLYLVIGLAKKIYIADPLAGYVDPIFQTADAGHALHAIEAVIGWLGYTMQLYFDFSAYGDMAIGLGLFFGVTLPINFNSPYKASSIIDFWRRWHMTLGAFLRDYLYIPLGGSKSGWIIKYKNLLITMLLGGLWHGAAWTFVFWGALHGLMLVINHSLNSLWKSLKCENNKAIRDVGIVFTFVGVSLAWIFFRAESFEGALSLFNALGQIPDITKESLVGFKEANTLDIFGALVLLFQAIVLVFIFPNSHKLVDLIDQKSSSYQVILHKVVGHPVSAIFAGVLFFFLGKELLAVPSAEFLYFNF